MSSKKQYLGWGLVGTPNGRQYTSDGADKQLKQAKIFELEQEVGGCLPDPKAGDFTPLYVLRQRIVGENHLLGFGEYFSIKEQGQTRAGTYLGSFIETVNSVFGVDSLKDIFTALYKLDDYQTKHFIDTQAKEYRVSINGVAFDAPHPLLDKIAEQLQPLPNNYLSQTPQEKNCFIHCEKGQILAVAEALLSNGWFYQYQNIFFTESEHICTKMQGVKMPQLSSSQLLSSADFTRNWKTEVQYLHNVIATEQNEKQAFAQDNQRLKTEQASLVKQEVERQAGQYKLEAENAKKQLQDYQLFGELGQQVFEKVANQAAQFGNSPLAQYASSESKEILSRLSRLESNIAGLSLKINTPPPEVRAEVIEKKSPLTAIFAILSLVLFIFAVGGWTTYWLDDSADKFKQVNEEKKKLQTEMESLKTEKEGEIKKLNNEIKRLQETPPEPEQNKTGKKVGK